MPPINYKIMEMKFIFANGVFCPEKDEFSRIMPFSHTETTIKFIEPINQSPDRLKDDFVRYLYKELKPYRLMPKWDNQEIMCQQRMDAESRKQYIKKIRLGIDFDLL